jgi:N-acetylmuramoyl-L-alanine amidase
LNLLNLPNLHLGVRSADVGNWQRYLKERGIVGPDGRELAVDEDFGAKTTVATKTWRAAHSLPVAGVVDAAARAVAVPDGFVQFLHAKNFTPIPRSTPRAIDLLVFHDMEYPETPEGAEWCAGFFAAATAPRASCHYSVDSNSIVQSVRDPDVAWHAPGANHNGIGIEHAGYAKQSRTEWLDPYSRAELAKSATLFARLARLYFIPLVRLTPEELRSGARGLCGHADVTSAFGPPGGHHDPGINFPWDVFVPMIKAA